MEEEEIKNQEVFKKKKRLNFSLIRNPSRAVNANDVQGTIILNNENQTIFLFPFLFSVDVIQFSPVAAKFLRLWDKRK